MQKPDNTAMALFNDYQDFAFHSMHESLEMAEMCLKTEKKEGSDAYYGMAAFILIASVMDTIGTFYRNGNFQGMTKKAVMEKNNGKKPPLLGGVKQHFDRYYERFLSGTIKKTPFMDVFYPYARCRATHNSVLGPNIEITTDSTPNKEIFSRQNGVLVVHLRELLDSVKQAHQVALKDWNQSLALEQYRSLTGSPRNNVSQPAK